MPLPPACTAHATLLLLSLSVQRNLKNTVWHFFPHVWVSLGFWPFVQDFQTFRAVVLPDCPRPGSPTYRGIAHLWIREHTCELCMHSPACPCVCSTNTSLQHKLHTQASLHPKAKSFLVKLSLEFGICVFLDQSLQRLLNIDL